MSVILVDYPLLLVNLKTYREGMGENAASLARIAERVYKRTGVSIAVAPQPTDLLLVTESTDTLVFSQHIDPIRPGAHTGQILPEAVVEAGCSGTLINHSERQMDIASIQGAIKRAKEVDLVSIVCVDTVKRARRIARMSPDGIAIEPPELIGSGIPVSKAQPEIISGTVEAVKKVNKNVKVLCGAGITNARDVEAAIELGAEGILVASGVVKAEDPYKALLDLAAPMRG
ncbi:MAG: triose-phosphate isomerase [Candidatus Bathyarchaeia archaeon]